MVLIKEFGKDSKGTHYLKIGEKFLKLKEIKGVDKDTLSRAKSFVRNELLLKEL